MKKIIVYVALAVSSIFLSVSCQKAKKAAVKPSEDSASYDFRTDNSFIETFGSNESQLATGVNQRLDLSELIKIANIEDDEVRKNTYSLLNVSEKVDFWNYVISTNIENGKFTESQTQLLKDLQAATIKPTIFSDKNLQQILGANFLPMIGKQLNLAGITSSEMERIFSSGTVVNKTTPGGDSMPDCNCNVGSHFSCSSCRPTDACFEFTDCGFGWLFICNGLCNPFYTPS
ncbi:MAG: bacteriocin fulvocin C-related protein [Bacteroidota bacterium]